MRVHLGSDHAGFELKAHLRDVLAQEGHDVVDVGPQHYDETDAYPPYCIAAALAVVAEPGSLGVVIGGSGNGEQIAANEVRGVRAALCWNPEIATLARQHNDAQVASIGARMHTFDEATEIVRTFLATAFEGGRHQERLDMLAEYERTGEPPALPE